MIEISIHETELRDLLQSFSDEQWPIADKEHHGDVPPDFLTRKYTILAKENDQIVGYMYLEIDMGVALINSLLVHNNFQRKGVASELTRKAEEKAKKESCHILKLETGKNWGSMKFYESQGYAVIADLKQYYNKEDYVLMEKRI